jgi:hypothetical protein
MKTGDTGEAAESAGRRKLERLEDLLVWQRAHALVLACIA